MLSRRPAALLRLLALALVIPGCGGGQTAVSPGPVSAPVPITSVGLTCALGTFTARLEVTTGDLNVEATADVQGAAVAQDEWLFEPGTPPVVTYQPRVLFAYSSPGYKAVELRAVLADGRVIRGSSHVIVGREHEA
jgi:hypothetical protein